MGKKGKQGVAKRTKRSPRTQLNQGDLPTPLKRKPKLSEFLQNSTYRRASEMKRRTNFVTRPLIALARFAFLEYSRKTKKWIPFVY